jgi:hypothetical protein
VASKAFNRKVREVAANCAEKVRKQADARRSGSH